MIAIEVVIDLDVRIDVLAVSHIVGQTDVRLVSIIGSDLDPSFSAVQVRDLHRDRIVQVAERETIRCAIPVGVVEHVPGFAVPIRAQEAECEVRLVPVHQVLAVIQIRADPDAVSWLYAKTLWHQMHSPIVRDTEYGDLVCEH